MINVYNFFCLQAIMKDKWMNVGHEDDELKPYIEPDNILNDPIRIGNF